MFHLIVELRSDMMDVGYVRKRRIEKKLAAKVYSTKVGARMSRVGLCLNRSGLVEKTKRREKTFKVSI